MSRGRRRPRLPRKRVQVLSPGSSRAHLRASGLIEAETDSRRVTYTISGDYLPTVAKMMSVIF